MITQLEQERLEGSEAYFGLFAGESGAPSGKRLTLALKEAQDNRRFEIGLYWQRSNYFFLFVGGAFAGFFGLETSDRAGDLQEPRILVGALGLVVSTAWHFANRGSKYWQEIWERHIDLLEDRVYGPLHKTFVSQKNASRGRWLSAQRYSVSKINHVLSLSAIVAWVFLLVRSLSTVLDFTEPFGLFNESAASVLALVACWLCTGKSDDSKKALIVETRRIVDGLPISDAR
jgi:hypothetical protein